MSQKMQTYSGQIGLQFTPPPRPQNRPILSKDRREKCPLSDPVIPPLRRQGQALCLPTYPPHALTLPSCNLYAVYPPPSILKIHPNPANPDSDNKRANQSISTQPTAYHPENPSKSNPQILIQTTKKQTNPSAPNPPPPSRKSIQIPQILIQTKKANQSISTQPAAYHPENPSKSRKS